MSKVVFVIGGVNTDISGTPDKAPVMQDSNIGRITITTGGVGHNMALGIAAMGLRAELIAAFGDDAFSRAAMDDCRRNGIGTDFSTVIHGGRANIYLCMNDEKGDMAVAVNEMETAARLAPEHINMDAVNGGAALMLDANAPEHTLLYAAKHARVPVFADPVSTEKAKRLTEVLPYLYAIKPNRIEAEYMTGIDCSDAGGVMRAAERLVAMGVKRAFVSAGKEGIAYSDGKATGIARPDTVYERGINTTGAGDRATAALLFAHLSGMGMAESAAFACREAGKFCKL